MSDDVSFGQNWRELHKRYFHTISEDKWSHEKYFDLPKSCFNQVNTGVEFST